MELSRSFTQTQAGFAFLQLALAALPRPGLPDQIGQTTSLSLAAMA